MPSRVSGASGVSGPDQPAIALTVDAGSGKSNACASSGGSGSRRLAGIRFPHDLFHANVRTLVLLITTQIDRAGNGSMPLTASRFHAPIEQRQPLSAKAFDEVAVVRDGDH